jgi:hypothetical protein
MITNDTRRTREIKFRITMVKATFNKTKRLFTSKLDLNLRTKLVKFYIWSIALRGAEIWTLRKADQKYLESFEMWCRRMEISWTDRVKNEEVLHRVNEESSILDIINRRKANWIGHILYRICLLKLVIEEKIAGMGSRRRRRKQLLADLTETRRCWMLKRSRFGRDCGPVVRQSTK